MGLVERMTVLTLSKKKVSVSQQISSHQANTSLFVVVSPQFLSTFLLLQFQLFLAVSHHHLRRVTGENQTVLPDSTELRLLFPNRKLKCFCSLNRKIQAKLPGNQPTILHSSSLCFRIYLLHNDQLGLKVSISTLSFRVLPCPRVSPLDCRRMSSRRWVIPRSSVSSSSLLSTRRRITSLIRSRAPNKFSAQPETTYRLKNNKKTESWCQSSSHTKKSHRTKSRTATNIWLLASKTCRNHR